MKRRKKETDLFGDRPWRHVRRMRTEVANGYAAPPGTGPTTESCSTCTHCRYRELRGSATRFYKCGQMTAQWDRSRETDILLRSPACRLWEAGEPSLSTTYIRDRS
jgi:hypothetical protein